MAFYNFLDILPPFDRPLKVVKMAENKSDFCNELHEEQIILVEFQ